MGTKHMSVTLSDEAIAYIEICRKLTGQQFSTELNQQVLAAKILNPKLRRQFLKEQVCNGATALINEDLAVPEAVATWVKEAVHLV